jgi:hypothetical protein
MDLKNKMVRLSDLSPRCLIRALLREAWMIVACAAIFAMAASLYVSWFHQPLYQATMVYAVTAREGSVNTSNHITVSKEVAAVMAELLKEDVITEKLSALSDALSYGIILRAKGIVEGKDGKWIHFDYIPGSVDVRFGGAEVTGRLCVIGSKIDEHEIEELFLK